MASAPLRMWRCNYLINWVMPSSLQFLASSMREENWSTHLDTLAKVVSEGDPLFNGSGRLVEAVRFQAARGGAHAQVRGREGPYAGTLGAVADRFPIRPCPGRIGNDPPDRLRFSVASATFRQVRRGSGEVVRL